MVGLELVKIDHLVIIQEFNKILLKLGQTCYYDIDGDGDKDSIKYYVSNEKLMLKVNQVMEVHLKLKFHMYNNTN